MITPASVAADALWSPVGSRRALAVASMVGVNVIARRLGVPWWIGVAANAGAIRASLDNASSVDFTALRNRLRQHDLAPLFVASGAAHGVSPYMLAGIAAQESSMRPDVTGPAPHNAVGLMQVLPSWGVTYGNLRDVTLNVNAGAAILRGYYDAESGSTYGALKRYGGFVTVDPGPYVARVVGYAFAFALAGF